MLWSQLPFLSSPNKRWHPPLTGPRHPRVSIKSPAQGLPRPAQILGRTSCGLWSRAALGTPAVGPRACLLPSEGLGFAQGTGPSLSTLLQPGRARLALCVSTLTPASAHGAQRRGPGHLDQAAGGKPWRGQLSSHDQKENGPWGSGHLESQRSFHLQQSWAPPLANCTPTFHEIWGGHSTQGTMEGRPLALSALGTECSPLTCLGTPGYLHALPFAPRHLPGEKAGPTRPPIQAQSLDA